MSMGPVALTERIHLLDVLRGMALFGIIASNMRAFNGPMAAYFDHSLMWQEPENRAAQVFIDFFISGKFITLFSFLFGIGFAVQMERADARGLTKQTFYLRRLAVLLVFGIAHMFLIWWGDILTAYALMGFFLFLFRRKSQASLLRWAAGLYCWPWVAAGAFLLASLAGASVPAPAPATQTELQRLITVYSTGTYAQIFAERVKDSMTSLMFIVFFTPRLLGIFLFGMWIWRSGIVRNVGGHVGVLRRCQFWGFIAGVILNGAMVAIQEIWHPDPIAPTVLGFVVQLIAGVALPAMSLFYASTLALVFQDDGWRRRLAPFGAIGRTALTNYLLQSVICTLMFYGYGFGLYGSVGPLVGLGITVVIYAVQVVASVWWLRRFEFGPMEWVWRVTTYGRVVARRAVAGAS